MSNQEQQLKQEVNLHEINAFLDSYKKSKKSNDVTALLKNCSHEISKSKVENSLIDPDSFINYCINDIFQYISYLNRIYLLNSLSQLLANDEQLAEHHYEKFKNNHSLSAARPFLKYCSAEFAVKNIKRGIFLTYRELQKILPQRSEFIIEYLRNLYEMLEKQAKYSHLIQTRSFEIIFRKLIITHTKECIQLFNDYRTHVEEEFPKFGKKNTKRILHNSNCKSIILKNPAWYTSHLDIHVIFKCLSEDEFKIFYKGLFPEKKKDFDVSLSNDNILEYLNYYRTKEKRLKLLLDTYQSMYNENLLDNISNLTPEIMKLLNAEQRVKFAQDLIATYNENSRNRRNSHFHIDNLICNLSCDLAIPKLKELISTSPDTKVRSKYLQYLIECCEINDDMSAFLEVLKYFNQRHRNELTEVRRDFISKLTTRINLKKLNADHWEQIRELLNLMAIYKELGQIWQWNVKPLLHNWIEFNLKNDLPIEDSLLFYIKWARDNYAQEWLLFAHNPEFQKRCLIEFGKLIPQIFEAKMEESEWFVYLESLTTWNKRHVKNDLISILDFQWICDQIDKMFAKEKINEYYLNELVKYLKFDDKAADVYMEKTKSKVKDATVEYLEFYIKENPDAIFRDFENFCSEALSPWRLKTYTLRALKLGKLKKVPQLEEKMRNFCLDVMKADINDEKKKNLKSGAVRLLACWLKPEEFYELTKTYFPEKNRVNTDEENSNKIYEIQTSIAFSLKKFKGHPRTFKALRKFCSGDFLKLTVGSLNGVCLTTPYYMVKEFLDSCLDTPLSFRKHIIRLQCLVCSQNYVIEFLQKIWANEKNPSIREIVLKKIFNYFVDEPSVKTWNLLKSCAESLKYKDKYSLKSISEIRSVSDEFISEYVEFFWNLLMKFEKDENVDVHSYKSDLLITLQSSLHLVSDTIITNILNEYLFEGDINDLIQEHYCDLMAHFILQSPTVEQEKRIDLCIEKIRKLYEKSWQIPSTTVIDQNVNSYMPREHINHLLKVLCKFALTKRNEYPNTHLALINLHEKLSKIFNPISVYIHDNNLKMQFSVIFIQNGGNFKEFGKNLQKIISYEIAEYGTYIIPRIAELIKLFLLELKDVKINEIVDGLLLSSTSLDAHQQQSKHYALVIIHLFRFSEIYKKENRQILKYLNEIDDKRVQMYLNKAH